MPDLTTAEMWARAEELRKLMQQYRGDIDRFSCVLDLALEALARREREGMALNGAWRCSCCGELMEGVDGSWRWNGTVWQHSHGEAGHFDARNFSDSPVTDGEGNKQT